MYGAANQNDEIGNDFYFGIQSFDYFFEKVKNHSIF